MKHSTYKDQPIKEMLDGITSNLVDRLLTSVYGGNESSVPRAEYLGASSSNGPHSVRKDVSEETRVMRPSSDSADQHEWLKTLAGAELNWLHALVLTPVVVQGTSYIRNPVQSLLAPRKGQRVQVCSSNGNPSSVAVFGAARSFGRHDDDFQSISIVYDSASMTISLTIFEDRGGSSVPLKLLFRYNPSQSYAPIHEITEGRTRRIKEFYWSLWFGDAEALPSLNTRAKFKGPQVTVDARAVERFCAVVGNQEESYQSSRKELAQAPMDFAIVLGWQVRDSFALCEAF